MIFRLNDLWIGQDDYPAACAKLIEIHCISMSFAQETG